MAIRFRCQECSGLMSIASRKAGTMVQCPTCGEQTLVPLHDIFESPPQPVLPIQVELPAPDFQGSGEPSMTVDRIVAPPMSPSVPVPAAIVQMEIGSVIEQPPEDVDNESGDDKPQEDDSDDAGPALQLRRRSRTDDEMDLTPMVDVTFQLLIFFMVTASFALQKSIEVPTPDQDKKGAAQQLQMIEDIEATSIQVQIDANNVILVDDETVPDVSRLPDMLRDKMRKEQKTELMISPNAAAMHRSVIAVIDAANEVGMQKIRMVSRPGKTE